MLWSGSLSKGRSVTISELPYYNLFGVSIGSTATELWGIMLIGGRGSASSSAKAVHVSAGLDDGSGSYFFKASFDIDNTTLKLQQASRTQLTASGNIGIALYVREIYGLF